MAGGEGRTCISGDWCGEGRAMEDEDEERCESEERVRFGPGGGGGAGRGTCDAGRAARRGDAVEETGEELDEGPDREVEGPRSTLGESGRVDGNEAEAADDVGGGGMEEEGLEVEVEPDLRWDC